MRFRKIETGRKCSHIGNRCHAAISIGATLFFHRAAQQDTYNTRLILETRCVTHYKITFCDRTLIGVDRKRLVLGRGNFMRRCCLCAIRREARRVCRVLSSFLPLRGHWRVCSTCASLYLLFSQQSRTNILHSTRVQSVYFYSLCNTKRVKIRILKFRSFTCNMRYHTQLTHIRYECIQNNIFFQVLRILFILGIAHSFYPSYFTYIFSPYVYGA